MTQHLLAGDHPQPFFDRDAPPRITIDSGDTLVLQCPEPCGQVTPQWTADDVANRWDKSRVHAMLGPIDVRQARAGGSLAVQIIDIAHQGWGWSGLIPNFGLMCDRFSQAHLEHWHLTDDRCQMVNHPIAVPFEPFVGCIAVAPEEPGQLSTLPPRRNGGNLDLRDITIGATIHMPVLRDGAGLMIGDGHAAQGDGELGGTAIEAPLTITVKVTVLPGTPIDGVRVDAPPRHDWRTARGLITTTAVGRDVRQTTRQAAGRMLDHLVSITDWPEPVAMMACSAAADVRIAQAVNEPNWTVAVSFPRGVLDQTTPHV